jgi:hypothetical protein
MKKIIPIFIIVLFIISSFGAVAYNNQTNELTDEGIEPTGTHRILGEYGTATWCGYCKYAHGALKELYKGGWHEFNYVTLVCDVNTHSYTRAVSQLGLTGYPTVFWDGNYVKDVGAGSIPGAMAEYNSSINTCGSRSVADIDVSISVSWLGSATMSITVTVDNNEASSYSGYLRCYVTEIASSMGWIDTGGHPYTFAFLDYAFNQAISAPAGGSWSDTITWDGAQYNDGYGNDFGQIEKDNMFIIASVFASSGGYVDETAEKRVGNNRPPFTPNDPNPDDGDTNVKLEPTLSWKGGDPDWFDDVYYDVYFEKDDPTPDVLVSEDQESTLYKPGTLEMESTYYWQIVTEDEYGLISTGPIWSFTTRGNDPPYSPNNPNPDDGETDVPLNTILSWTGGDPDGDKTYYDVYFEKENPDPALVSEEQTSRTYDPGELEYETTYYWKIVSKDSFGEITEGPIWSFTTMAPQPNLECFGLLQWNNVGAGTTVTGSFTVENIGTPTSELYWEISEYPEWGTWTFTPDQGDALTPENSPVTIQISVLAPSEKNKEFTGNIKIINVNDTSDFDIMPVSLKTPRSKPVFLNIFERFLGQYHHIYLVLLKILGL